MKANKFLLLIALVAFAACAVSAQNRKNALVDDLEGIDVPGLVTQINTKAELFCEYVEKVGTKNNIPRAEKRRIVSKDVPSLFYEYDSCYMVTTSGVNGTRQNRKKMRTYFNNLLRQSEQPLNMVGYDLHFSPVLVSDMSRLGGWKFVKTLADGSKVYQRLVKLRQTYFRYMPELTSERKFEKYEVDNKYITITLIVDPHKTARAFLGNVTKAIRQN